MKTGRWLVLAICAGAILSVRADSTANVVAWWSMNGETGTELVSVASRGDTPGALTAVAVKTNNGAEEPTASRAPIWTNAVGRALGVLDPLTGTVYAETNAVRFIAPKLNSDAGMLRVAKPQALRLSTFTFETFVRRDLSRINGDWNVIAVMPGSLKTSEAKTLKNCDSWGLRFTSSETISLRLTKSGYTVATGAQVVGSGENKEYTTLVPGAADGLWHHLAFSIDSEAKKVKLYWDYALKCEKALENPIWYGDEDLFMGATLQTAGPLHGCLAQVRILDQAVGPESFLRIVRAEKGAGVADDVLFHYDFEPEDGLPPRTYYNLAATGQLPVTMKLSTQNGVVCPSPESDAPSASVRPSYLSTVSNTNGWSLANSYTNASDRATGACLRHDMNGEDPFTNTSFTVECFYKSNDAIPQYTPFVRRRGGYNVQFNLGVSSSVGCLTASYQRSPAFNDGGSITDSLRTDDGNWHHTAMVVDYEKKVFSLYRDYLLVGTKDLGTDHLTPSTYPICVSGVEGVGNTFKGCLDDVRITMRALTATEFLTSRPVIETNPLAYVRFETNSLLSIVNPYILSNATATAYTGGREPSFSSDVPGTRIREGEDGPVHVNAASLAFQTGVVKYAANTLLPLYSAQTIEFFVKLDAPPQQWASIARCNRSTTITDPTWALGFADANGQINLRFDIDINGEIVRDQSKGAINGGTKMSIRDRRWHHLALAFEPKEEGGTKAMFWLDYCENPYVIETSGDMIWEDGKAPIWLGQTGASPSFIGKIDELRISKGVLDPSEFLRVEPSGTMVIIR